MPMRRTCAISRWVPSAWRTLNSGSGLSWPVTVTVFWLYGRKVGGNWLKALSVLSDDINSQTMGANSVNRPTPRYR